MVRHAVGLPNVGEFGDPRVLVELGELAENSGWDGVYLWDHVLYRDPQWSVANPIVALAGIAARTARVRLGVLINALPRRRVQTVARESVTLDVLSGGRLVVGAGLGSIDAEYAGFGEDADLRVRAAKLDESLDALVALWSGWPVSYAGRYVRISGARMLPVPVQRPRIPIWCGGRWPNRAGFRRAARWDGVLPTFADYGRSVPVPPSVFAEVTSFLSAERGSLDGFDVALEGQTAPGATVSEYADAGLTWWIEAMGWWRGGVAEAHRRIAAGP